MTQKFGLLNNLDKPMRILIFTINDFIAIFAPFAFFWLCFKQIGLGLMLSFISYSLLKIIKPPKNVSYKSMLSWFMPRTYKKHEMLPASHIREYFS